jgi:dipeptidyl aminopeptidase/acylaminoacyl peptidase
MAELALTMNVWYDDPDVQVAVVSADGRQMRKLGGGGQLGGSAWSRAGRALLDWYGWGTDLWNVSADGAKPRRIWRIRHRGLDDSLSEADWAPDGRHFAAATRAGIVTMTRDGTGVVQITHGFDVDGSPEWSPDGRAIAFVRQAADEAQDIYVVRADGRGLLRLSSDAWAPLWSPDGRSIMFSDASGIHVAEDNSVRRLPSERQDYAVAWSPDARKILFVRRDELWVMDADGGDQFRLPFNRPGWTVVSADWGRW